MALNDINIKKYVASHLIAGKQAWRDLFRNTLYVANSVWLTVQAGDPYPFVYLPRDCERLLFGGVVDRCGDIHPLYYNSVMNIVPKPTEKKCGCTHCDCSGLCEDINSTTFTTNVLFTINGIDYSEKTWIKYGTNGDILEFKETPYKKYNSMVGDGGDFNNDFNNDYSNGNAGLVDFDIATRITQRKLCALKTYPCGCPMDIPENEALVRNHCSCFMPFFGRRRREHCEHFLSDRNQSEYGDVKLSDCGTKLYFRSGRRRHDEKRVPDFILISYQTNGDPQTLNTQIQVPEFAKIAIWAGVDYYKKLFNSKYTGNEKKFAEYVFIDKKDDVFKFLNPLSPQVLSDVQDARIKW